MFLLQNFALINTYNDYFSQRSFNQSPLTTDFTKFQQINFALSRLHSREVSFSRAHASSHGECNVPSVPLSSASPRSCSGPLWSSSILLLRYTTKYIIPQPASCCVLCSVSPLSHTVFRFQLENFEPQNSKPFFRQITLYCCFRCNETLSYNPLISSLL
jgi:hypothetical protein